MKHLRRLGFALWLALALVVGQHAALLHDLGHASESLAHKQGQPTQTKCDKCFACAQLTGVAASVVAIPPVACDVADFVSPESGAPSRLALAYRSQAPPALL